MSLAVLINNIFIGHNNVKITKFISNSKVFNIEIYADDDEAKSIKRPNQS